MRPPDHLAGSGHTLWTTITRDYELSTAEQTILAEACSTADELDRLRDALSDASTIVTGSTQQPVVNRLFDELRKHRDTLARLLAHLQVTDDANT
ncbi:hypothetical protein CDG81_00925 [Actinopolyspora erythraea]|uniref:Uncharacterized protein n=2 Tax=Actinopolyspora TaxID=1849 RepID=A0A1I2B1I1_9ACTN|nr:MULTISPECIES: hypothetical protein [Actinopolyspora]ASU77124.1 hypothetical protein CDG81_00925 [Actinopolyspora erythraea]SFE49899.1 hypothetical protein SAMN04487819_11516 [Actinopolyspora alba]